jgi:hypothetical protein
MSQSTSFVLDTDTKLRYLVNYSIKVGSTVKNTGVRQNELHSIVLQFGALYFPNLAILTVFWGLTKGERAQELGRVAKSEFIDWEGGLPVYRKVEEHLVEARKWVGDFLVTKIDPEGRLDEEVFTRDPSFEAQCRHEYDVFRHIGYACQEASSTV